MRGDRKIGLYPTKVLRRSKVQISKKGATPCAEGIYLLYLVFFVIIILVSNSVILPDTALAYSSKLTLQND